MELIRLVVTHVFIGTAVALGMAAVPTLAWLVQRLGNDTPRKNPGRIARG